MRLISRTTTSNNGFKIIKERFATITKVTVIRTKQFVPCREIKYNNKDFDRLENNIAILRDLHLI